MFSGCLLMACCWLLVAATSKDCIGWIDLNSSLKNLGESTGWSDNGSDILMFFIFWDILKDLLINYIYPDLHI